MVGFQKRYDSEKYYVFIVSLRREKQSENMYLFRTHREFSELHQKLCLRFPLVSSRILSLSKGVYLGRSSVKAVAEKRRTELDQFLTSLFQLAPEICHCDLIYTFFHPLLRDQDEEANVYVTKWRNKSSSSRSVSNANGHVQGLAMFDSRLLSCLIFFLKIILRLCRRVETIDPVYERRIACHDPAWSRFSRWQRGNFSQQCRSRVAMPLCQDVPIARHA